MKKYARILEYLKAYKPNILLYFICILFSIVFSVVSVGMLMPFMDLIFKGDDNTSALGAATGNPIIKFTRNALLDIIHSGGENGKIKALGIICIMIMVSIFLKKPLYLSFFLYT
jgi:subfamily B ATP-binding cassette protein MsbA